MKKVAVVILNYNGRELLQKFLPSVIQFSGGAHIVVADNNSTDGSADLILTNFPSISLIKIPTNLGFCGGYNFALQRVEAEYYVLLNSDIEVTEGWLNQMLSLLESQQNVAAVQPKILSQTEKHKFEYAGASGGFIDWLGYPFCRGRIFETIEEDEHQYESTISVFWASGACMMVRSTLYHQLNGLDETFFAHMEEIDFCWRLYRSGYRVMVCPESTVYHVGGATLNKSNPQKTYYNFRNGLQMLLKNLSLAQLIVRLPARIFLDWVAAIKFLIEGNARHAWAICRAHFYVVIRIPRMLKSSQIPKPPLKDGIYTRSIVFDYYLFGRKRFDRLKF